MYAANASIVDCQSNTVFTWMTLTIAMVEWKRVSVAHERNRWHKIHKTHNQHSHFTSHGLISHGIVSLSLWILCMCKRFHVASTQFINHIHTALDFSAASISRNNCLTIFCSDFLMILLCLHRRDSSTYQWKKIPRWLIRYNRAAIDISIKWFIIYQIILITSGLKWNFHCRTVNVSGSSIGALITVLIRMSFRKKNHFFSFGSMEFTKMRINYLKN